VGGMDDLLRISRMSRLCPACAGEKGPGHILCDRCYFGLPLGLRKALRGSIGSARAEAFDRAMKCLKVWDPAFPEK
jgi:hypothetical protein